jgi:hypothetical protein
MNISILVRTLAQDASETVTQSPWPDSFHRIYELLSPYNEFIVVLFVLWLFARRGRPKQGDFNRQAQLVLEEKYKQGEISKKTFEKYRQDISLRPKR